MKRLITYTKLEDNRGLITSISNPVDTESISFSFIDNSQENTVWVDETLPNVQQIEGKTYHLYINLDTNVIEVEYEDISFDNLSMSQKLEYLFAENVKLKEENETLRSELDLTHSALFELDAQLLGGDS